jgi:hypothetical protein
MSTEWACICALVRDFFIWCWSLFALHMQFCQSHWGVSNPWAHNLTPQLCMTRWEGLLVFAALGCSAPFVTGAVCSRLCGCFCAPANTDSVTLWTVTCRLNWYRLIRSHVAVVLTHGCAAPVRTSCEDCMRLLSDTSGLELFEGAICNMMGVCRKPAVFLHVAKRWGGQWSKYGLGTFVF